MSPERIRPEEIRIARQELADSQHEVRPENLESLRELLLAQFPGLGADITVEPMGNGANNFAILVSAPGRTARVFRFATRRSASEQMESEISLLPQLQARLPLPIPRISYVGTQPNGWLFQGYERVDGKPLTGEVLASLPPAKRNEVLDDLARFLKDLHEIDHRKIAGAKFAVIDYVGWVARVAEDARDQLFAALTDAERARFMDAMIRYADIHVSREYKLALIHGDIKPEHVLFDSDSGAISGVIDWGDILVGDPLYDFMRIYQTYGPATTLELISRCGSEHPERDRDIARTYAIAWEARLYMKRTHRGDIEKARKNLMSLRLLLSA